jgi:hypothetical protein
MGSWGHLSNDQVHEVACFYAAAAAVTHGHRVKLVDEDRRYRLRVNGALVQVPAQRAGAWQVSDVARPLADDTDAVIFVDLSGDAPDFYVVSADWVRQDVARHHREFLDRVGGTRPRNPNSTHHAIDVARVAEWHQRWEVL